MHLADCNVAHLNRVEGAGFQSDGGREKTTKKEKTGNSRTRNDHDNEKMKERNAFRRTWNSLGRKLPGDGRHVVSGFVAGGFTGALHELPYRSLISFLATFMIATVGSFFIIPMGVVASGSVWTIPVTIGVIAILIVVVCLVSLANFVRGLISSISDTLRSRGGGGSVVFVHALFRGYFGGILQAGCIILTFNFLLSQAQGLFLIPMFYLIPIDVMGFTVPIPVFLGFSGIYIIVAVAVVTTVVLVASFLMGGLELLQAVKNHVENLEGGYEGGSSRLYAAALYLLFLTLFPAVNVLLCSWLIGAYKQVMIMGVA